MDVRKLWLGLFIAWGISTSAPAQEQEAVFRNETTVAYPAPVSGGAMECVPRSCSCGPYMSGGCAGGQCGCGCVGEECDAGSTCWTTRMSNGIRRHWYRYWQRKKKLQHAECPPFFQTNWGYHPTCWRRFPPLCNPCPMNGPCGFGPANGDPMQPTPLQPPAPAPPQSPAEAHPKTTGGN